MATLLAFSSYKSPLETQSSRPQTEQRPVLDTLLSALNKEIHALGYDLCRMGWAVKLISIADHLKAWSRLRFVHHCA